MLPKHLGWTDYPAAKLPFANLFVYSNEIEYSKNTGIGFFIIFSNMTVFGVCINIENTWKCCYWFDIDGIQNQCSEPENYIEQQPSVRIVIINNCFDRSEKPFRFNS